MPRKLTALVIVMGFLVPEVTFEALPASAQLDLSWRNCAIGSTGEPFAAQNENFNCLSTSEYILYGTFRVPRGISEAIALEGTIDLTVESSSGLQPFWHFETDPRFPRGCNASGIEIKDAKGEFGGCAEYATPWGENGEQALAGTYYIPYPEGAPNRGRLLVDVSRKAQEPVPLDSLTNYYGFHLVFKMTNAQRCSGCNEPVVLVWNSAGILSPDGTTFEWSGYDNGSCARINGASTSTCGATPVLNTTWGRIKSIYR